MLRQKAPLNKLNKINKSVERQVIPKDNEYVWIWHDISFIAEVAREKYGSNERASQRGRDFKNDGIGNYADLHKYYRKPPSMEPTEVAKMIKEKLAPGKSAQQLKGNKYNNISREIMGRALQIEEQEREREGQVRIVCMIKVELWQDIGIA